MRQLAALVLVCAGSVFADGLDRGFSSYEAGRYDEAFAQLMPSAKQGEAKAQYCIGWMFEHGQGTSRDYEEAARWYAQAAGQSNADAQCALGGLYEFGMGVERSIPQAGTLYQKAAAQGHEEAMRNLRELEKRGLIKASPLASRATAPATAATTSTPSSSTKPETEAAALAAYNARPTAEGLRRLCELRYRHAAEQVDVFFRTGSKEALADGLAYAEAVLEQDPGHEKTRLLLGSLAYLSALNGEPTAAIAEEHLDYALARNPGNPQPRLMLAQLAMQQGWYNRALDYFEPLLLAQPDYINEPILVLMTSAYLADGQARRGEAFLRGLNNAYPQNAQTLLGLAAILSGSGRSAAAAQCFQQLIGSNYASAEIKGVAQARLAALNSGGTEQ